MEQDNETLEAHAKSIWKAELFIQENLDQELTLYQVAKVAGFSSYHSIVFSTPLPASL